MNINEVFVMHFMASMSQFNQKKERERERERGVFRFKFT